MSDDEQMIVRSDEEWKQRLTPEQYAVLRQAATEPPGTGALLRNHATGVYRCAACGNELFRSDTKYDSGTGWPSFWDPVSPGAVSEHEDRSHGMVRVEFRCGRCGGHLGHMFTDGPRPTGLRYCTNSCALDFDPGETARADA